MEQLGLQEEDTSMRAEGNGSHAWAVTVRFALIVIVFLIGLFIAYAVGDEEWVAIYSIASGLLMLIALIYVGIYAIMRLLAARDTAMAQAFADLLHAHSISGAQQFKAVQEVIRGANQMNLTDAKIQAMLIGNQAKLAHHYDKRLADMKLRGGLERAFPDQEAEEDWDTYYDQPDDDAGEPYTQYQLPSVRDEVVMPQHRMQR